MSISLQADSNLPQGYILVNGTAAATIRQDGALVVPSLSATSIRSTGTIVGNLSGNVTGNVVGNATTATSASNIVPSSNLGLATCKAWVNFDGFTGAIKDQYNINSIGKSAAGQYTIFFINPLSNNNYTVVGSKTTNSNLNNAVCLNAGTLSYETDRFLITTKEGSTGTNTDATIICLQVFGR